MVPSEERMREAADQPSLHTFAPVGVGSPCCKCDHDGHWKTECGRHPHPSGVYQIGEV